jgi:hypothetical protein
VLTAVALIFRKRIQAYALDPLRAASPADPARTARLTIITGAVLGVLVSISSVGAGALGVTALFFLYPAMPALRIVGSDIAHAVPLTAVAGIGHWMLGSIDWLLARQPARWLAARDLAWQPHLHQGLRSRPAPHPGDDADAGRRQADIALKTRSDHIRRHRTRSSTKRSNPDANTKQREPTCTNTTNYDQHLLDERVAQFRDQMGRHSWPVSSRTKSSVRCACRTGFTSSATRRCSASRCPTAISPAASCAGSPSTVARNYDRGYAHFTTRTNVQFNWPKLEGAYRRCSPNWPACRCMPTRPRATASATSPPTPSPAWPPTRSPIRVRFAEILRQWATYNPEFALPAAQVQDRLQQRR